MNVIILAAGYAERLYPITKNFPKSLLLIKGEPLLDSIYSRISCLDNIESVYLVSNALFFNHFQIWASKKFFLHPFVLVNNNKRSPQESLGAVGDIHFVIKKYQLDSDLFIIAGDNYFEDELSLMVKMSQKNSKKHSVIGVVSMQDQSQLSQYGLIFLNDRGFIKSILEKPKNPQSNLVSTSLYYLTRETLSLLEDYVKQKKNLDALGYFFNWLAHKIDIVCYFLQKQWYDIGSIEIYHSLKTFQKKKSSKKR